MRNTAYMLFFRYLPVAVLAVALLKSKINKIRAVGRRVVSLARQAKRRFVSRQRDLSETLMTHEMKN
jgi:hypothetical protein